MTGKTVSDEMLMAFIDGELDASTAAEVSAAVDRDHDLARRAELFARTRQASREAYADTLSEPVPSRLVASVVGDGVTPTGAVDPRRNPGGAWGMALAACLALAIGLGAGFWLSTAGTTTTPSRSAGLLGNAPALIAALAEQLSGEARAIEIDGRSRTVSMLGTYPVDGSLCRTFQIAGREVVSGVRGLACNREGGFRIEVAVRDRTDPDLFGTASGGAAGAIDAYLDALGASTALDKSQEAEALGITRN